MFALQSLAFSSRRRWHDKGVTDEVSFIFIDYSSTAAAVPLLSQEKAFLLALSLKITVERTMFTPHMIGFS